MKENRKKRLVDLGASALADILIELASLNDMADDLLERLIATPKENAQRFKTKLSAIKRSRRFIRWGESAGFASELKSLLQDLKASVNDSCDGAELVAAFYKTDKRALGNCDDSSGHVGDVYRYDAKELFVDYARQCPDKDKLTKLVLKLNQEDDYGVRDTLIDCAAEYLPEPNMRILIGRIQKAADKETDKYGKRHWLYLIESLARQIKDPELFEKTRITSWGTLSTAACVDIGRVYLDSNDAQTALSWLKKISSDDNYQAQERDRLLLDIHDRLGDKLEQTDVAWRIFRRHRNKDSFQELLSVIGDEQHAAIATGEVESILAAKELSLSDATFLIELGNMDAAENYLLGRVDQVNGDLYGVLLPLAEDMENDDRYLAATVVYRSLLDSILRRGRTKTYPHGVRYLKKLDQLSQFVPDWRSLDDHDAYSRRVRQTHGRKSSFWSQYGN